LGGSHIIIAKAAEEWPAGQGVGVRDEALVPSVFVHPPQFVCYFLLACGAIIYIAHLSARERYGEGKEELWITAINAKTGSTCFFLGALVGGEDSVHRRALVLVLIDTRRSFAWSTE
jgi:hypothetical protein